MTYKSYCDFIDTFEHILSKLGQKYSQGKRTQKYQTFELNDNTDTWLNIAEKSKIEVNLVVN